MARWSTKNCTATSISCSARLSYLGPLRYNVVKTGRLDMLSLSYFNLTE